MEVLGRDAAREGYRVATGGDGRLVGLVPETLIAEGVRLTGGHGHRTAYDWLARHAREIEDTLRTRAAGGRPKPPFDRIVLEEEQDHAD
jgi:hypothetical protein